MLRTATIQITTEGRDQGGVFTLTEKPAWQATEWFLRAMQLLASSGADVPPNIMQSGVAGFITMGIGTVLTGLGKAPWSAVKPLLDELDQCITSYQPPGGSQPLMGWQVIRGQIQEPSTILLLREEVVSLHLGFSLRAKLSTFRALAASMMTTATTPITETSTPLPEPLSAPASPV